MTIDADDQSEAPVSFTQLLAQSAVTDLDRAEAWYAKLFGRGPDARPMAGLVEWHLADTFGVQLWADPDAAGHSVMVIDTPDLDAVVSALDEAGLDHPDPQDVTASRVLALTDPDGNQIAVTGPFAD